MPTPLPTASMKVEQAEVTRSLFIATNCLFSILELSAWHVIILVIIMQIVWWEGTSSLRGIIRTKIGEGANKTIIKNDEETAM